MTNVFHQIQQVTNFCMEISLFKKISSNLLLIDLSVTPLKMIKCLHPHLDLT